ncbi:porin family protein [Hymenobacter latericus]|uniref:porin family protein n=1 Tax=Hymenobacter sp. YIM 151858-1 TaxID=2987688 RepID=UPI0022276D7F|nr:porin family protein [Hymenobacter sp. YIM 151858-1]UYZ58797.1 PorT family protein [Hymenobacter sp. YIM 151858-1]
MKHFVFILTFCTLAALSAQAQGIRFGVKAGANYSNLAGDVVDEDRYESKFGVHGGLMLNVGLIDDGFLSLQPELLFSQKGFKYADRDVTIGNDRFRFTGKLTYNYLDVPVLLKINAGGLFFEAGPQFGYLLSASDDIEITRNGQTQTSSQNYSNLDDVKRTEVGYAAGLGYQAKSGPMIGLRYNGSLTDFADDGYQGDEFRNARNSVFLLSVGFMFGGE